MTAASIQSSAVFSVASKCTGEVYQISLGLPKSYFTDPTKVFPVVYMVDANIEFEAVVGLARLMQLGGLIPDFAVVGIGYPLAGNYGDGLAEFGKRSSQSQTSYMEQIISVSLVNRFTALLQGRGYQNLSMSTKVFEGHGHFDVFGPFVTTGLDYLFSSH